LDVSKKAEIALNKSKQEEAECLLWHGTLPASADQIAIGDFKLALAGSHTRVQPTQPTQPTGSEPAAAVAADETPIALPATVGVPEAPPAMSGAAAPPSRAELEAFAIKEREGWASSVLADERHGADTTLVKAELESQGRFEEAKWQWRNCSVHFVTDLLAIRAEQARARAAKIQAEAERLARLPFEGAHDPRHLEQVQEEYKFQGYVEGAEHRAIGTLDLKRIMEWTSRHCHRWRDPRTRQKLHMDMMNLYQLNHWLIRPATLEKDCSFSELLTKEKQMPTWFVIHWWGEKVTDFLRGEAARGGVLVPLVSNL